MGAAASVETVSQLDASGQRAACDALFDQLDKTSDGKLNLLELKKGWEELEAQGTSIKLPYKRFAKVADADGDKMIDKVKKEHRFIIEFN